MNQDKHSHANSTNTKPGQGWAEQTSGNAEELLDNLFEAENRKIYIKKMTEKKNDTQESGKNNQNTPLKETIEAFKSWFTEKNNMWMVAKEFYDRSNELLKQDFHSIAWLTNYIINSPYQEIFIGNFLEHELSNLSENTQLAILYKIGVNWESNIKENTMNIFYIGFGEKVQSEKIAEFLVNRSNRLARENILYNKHLSKDFMQEHIIKRLLNDKDDFIRNLARDIKKIFDQISV